MNPAPYAIAAATGFALALLSGLLGGVGLGEGFLRGLLAAVVFGGGAFGLHQLLLRVFPELFSPEPAEEAPLEAPIGSGIDVTVGDSEDSFTMEMGGSRPSMTSSMSSEDDGPRMPEGEMGEMDDFSTQNSLPDMPGGAMSGGSGGDSSNFGGLGSMEGGDNVLLEGMDDDPATLAKAVQSVMKKDND